MNVQMQDIVVMIAPLLALAIAIMHFLHDTLRRKRK